MSWLLLFGVGLLLDLMLGTKALLGKLPHVDTLLHALFTPLERRLDRPHRSHTTLRVRAAIAQMILLPTAFFAGNLLNSLTAIPHIGIPLCALLVARSIGIRACWDAAIDTARASNTRPHMLRAASERLGTAFVRDWVCNMVLFTLGGFCLLLPFRLIAAALQARENTGAAKPHSIFRRAFVPGFDLLALPGTIFSSLVFSLAPILVPGSNLTAFRGFFIAPPLLLRGILSRFIPLSVMAYALGFSFAFDQRADGGQWIGPKHGRAQLGARDMKAVTMFMLAAGGLTTLAMLMLGASLQLANVSRL